MLLQEFPTRDPGASGWELRNDDIVWRWRRGRTQDAVENPVATLDGARPIWMRIAHQEAGLREHPGSRRTGESDATERGSRRRHAIQFCQASVGVCEIRVDERGKWQIVGNQLREEHRRFLLGGVSQLIVIRWIDHRIEMDR